MSDLTNYLESQYIAWVADEQQMPTPPATLYVSLHSDTPGEAPDGSTEIAAGGYARQTVDPANLTGSGGERSNDVAISFGPATEDWPTVTHSVVWDGPDDTDNPLYHSKLSEAKTVTTDKELRLKTGDLILGVR